MYLGLLEFVVSYILGFLFFFCGGIFYCFFWFFFFFKQKTAYEMRISDWSSDVCSSDLPNTRNGCRFGRRRRITRFTVCQRRNRGNSADDWPCLVQRSAASGEPLQANRARRAEARAAGGTLYNNS